MQKNIPIPLQCQNKSGIRERPRQNDRREESGNRSRKGKDKTAQTHRELTEANGKPLKFAVLRTKKKAPRNASQSQNGRGDKI